MDGKVRGLCAAVALALFLAACGTANTSGLLSTAAPPTATASPARVAAPALFATATAPLATPSTATPLPATATPPPTVTPPSPTATPVPREAVEVVEAFWSNMIKVRFPGGQIVVVRYLGVDTPRDPRGGSGECYGAEATAYNSGLVAGRVVYLERDTTDSNADHQLLRYVWVTGPDGITRHVNEELVKWGYAAAAVVPPDVRYQELFLAAQRDAQAQRLGLWGVCGQPHQPLPTPTPIPPTATRVPPTATRVPPTPTALPAPLVTVSPVGGPPGTKFVFSGTGFPAGARVTWVVSGGNNGAFQLAANQTTFTLTLDSSDMAPGRYAVDFSANGRYVDTAYANVQSVGPIDVWDLPIPPLAEYLDQSADRSTVSFLVSWTRAETVNWLIAEWEEYGLTFLCATENADYPEWPIAVWADASGNRYLFWAAAPTGPDETVLIVSNSSPYLGECR